MKLLSNEHDYDVKLELKRKGGGRGRVDGKPVWSRSADAFDLDVAEDGLSAVIITPDDDLVRKATLRITADADLGEGLKQLVLEQTIVTGPPAADDLGLVFKPRKKSRSEDEPSGEEEQPTGESAGDEGEPSGEPDDAAADAEQ